MEKEEKKKGKLIYQPSGPALEYSKWAVNLFNGCPHGCTYCYNRRGVLSHAFGDKEQLAAPIIKEAMKIAMNRGKLQSEGVLEPTQTESDFMISTSNLIAHDLELLGDEIRNDGGLFFSFKCDPLTKQTAPFTFCAVHECMKRNIPVSILTKSTDWVEAADMVFLRELVTIGFTLTGCDKFEPNAPLNDHRLNAMKRLYGMGFKLFVSVEPVIDLNRSLKWINLAIPCCKEFRIGLMSPYKKDRYDRQKLIDFIRNVYSLQVYHHLAIQWKKSVIDELHRKNIPYKMFPDGTLIV